MVPFLIFCCFIVWIGGMVIAVEYLKPDEVAWWPLLVIKAHIRSLCRILFRDWHP